MEEILKKIKKFRDDRDWMRFHKPKDMAVSISIESAELLEQFQWKNDAEVDEYIKKHRDEIADEIADVGMYLFELSDNLGIDLMEAMDSKLEKNKKKYPAGEYRGVAGKE